MTKFTLPTDQENAKALKNFNDKVPAIRELFDKNQDRSVGDRPLTLDGIAAKYNAGSLKFDSIAVAEKIVDEGYTPHVAVTEQYLVDKGFYSAAPDLHEDPLTTRLFDAYHELEDLHEHVHLLKLKLSQIQQVLTCDLPAQASVIAALSILNDVRGTESDTVESEPHTKRSV